jgi:hypothetical protein
MGLWRECHVFVCLFVRLCGSTTLLLGCGRFSSFWFSLQSVGLLGWRDQPVAVPLFTRRTAQTEYTHRDIHAMSGIRTHDLSTQAGGDISLLSPRGHGEQQNVMWEIEPIWTIGLLSLSRSYSWKKKSKVIPVTGRGGMYGCKMSRFTHCLDNRFKDGGCQPYKPAAFYPAKIFWYSFPLVNPRAMVWLEGLDNN